MSKRQLIDEIRSVNRTALPEFLARFNEVDLTDYLQHLIRSQAPRLRGNAARYGQYFSARATARAALARPVAAAVAILAEDMPAAEDVSASSPRASWRDAMAQPAVAREFEADNDAWIDDEEWIDDLAATPSTDHKKLTLTAATRNTTSSTPATDKWLF